MESVSKERIILVVCGVIFAAVAIMLAIMGNPKNMAICIACFIRDSAGAMQLHTAAPVQYLRPEIIGMILGAMLMAVCTKEFKSSAGSSPFTRFLLGFCVMIGCLVFLGCPLRMVLRMAAGDLNAWVALIGFAAGIGVGVFFLKNGFSLGIRSQGSDHFAIAFPVVRRKAAFSGDGKLRACQRFFGQCVGFYDLYLELNRLIGSLQFCGLV